MEFLMAHVPSVIELTQALIAYPSPSQQSNETIANYLSSLLKTLDFKVEEISYSDRGERKVSLIARKGAGEGGLGIFSHSDTVPGDAGWEPFNPMIQGGKIIGRGSA